MGLNTVQSIVLSKYFEKREAFPEDYFVEHPSAIELGAYVPTHLPSFTPGLTTSTLLPTYRGCGLVGIVLSHLGTPCVPRPCCVCVCVC